MQYSELHKIFSRNLLYNWIDEIEKEYDATDNLRQPKKIIDAETDEHEKEKLKNLYLATKDKIFYILFETNARTLDLGIKIGIDLQKSFDYFDKEIL